jgi:TPR repeat protein
MYAQYNLGWAYEHGEGTVKDIVKATKWYNLAAKQGHIQAQEKIKKLS